LALAAVALAGMFITSQKKTDAAIPVEVSKAFSLWMSSQNKQYNTPSESTYRLKVFYQNYLKVAKHNDASYKLGLNLFADLTEEEFTSKYMGLKVDANKPRHFKPSVKVGDDPKAIDWRDKGAVNAVKDQGQCGSCWAFSAIAALESAAKIFGSALYSLSEQQLVDCSTAQGNQGCDGGWMDSAYDYIIKVGGIETETNYPYRAVDQKCAEDKSKFVSNLTVKDYTDIGKKDCKHLHSAVAQQPVAVAIAANAIQFYVNGVFSSKFCGDGLNHGVAAVGYGHDDIVHKDFWIVRNSWGKSWGEHGYIRMLGDLDFQKGEGICGICLASSYPNINH